MSLGLHPDCAKRLEESVADALGHIKVRHRWFIDSRSLVPLYLANNVLPTQGRQRDAIEEYLGEMPIVDFVMATLADELSASQEYDSNKAEPEPLTGFPGYGDLESVAHRLVSQFESLPWDYVVSVPMARPISDLFCAQLKDHTVSDSIRIVCSAEVQQRAFPLTSGDEKRDAELAVTGRGMVALALLGKQLEWKQLGWQEGTAYIQLHISGFIGRYTSGASFAQAIGLMRAFCGLGIGMRLFTVEPKYSHFASKLRAFVHRNVDGAWRLERNEELDPLQSETLNSLVLHDQEGRLISDPQRAAWMRACLDRMGKVFAAKERSRNVVLASQWLFDSYRSTDELLSFVQTVVVLEILLGEKGVSDLIGLGQLLANRCAYLISRTQSEREAILQSFRDIYEVRSSIVHRGKTRLTLEERALFDRLRWMCRRVIQQEVEFLVKEGEEPSKP